VNKLYILHELPKKIDVITYMTSENEEVSYRVCIGIDSMKEDVFISYNIKQATLKHFECVELMERCIERYPIYPPEQIVDMFKFSFKVAAVIKLMGENDL